LKKRELSAELCHARGVMTQSPALPKPSIKTGSGCSAGSARHAAHAVLATSVLSPEKKHPRKQKQHL